MVDKKLFKLEDLKEYVYLIYSLPPFQDDMTEGRRTLTTIRAYQYLWDQKYIGKLCIEIE